MFYPTHHKAMEKQRKTPGEVFRKNRYVYEAIMHMWLKFCRGQYY